uniref:Uncharacterized protein n=1 Tax=Aegilops tauschii subsp. strangulata TaxID=200361 RepID=A0A452XS45_AEGTS
METKLSARYTIHLSIAFRYSKENFGRADQANIQASYLYKPCYVLLECFSQRSRELRTRVRGS